MSRYYERNDSGYTRGGLDVVTGINLFFKGILIFPILVLATYLGLAMVKHMIFQGVPSMNSPTEEQREMISDRDAQISTSVPDSRPVTPGVTDGTSVTPYDYPELPQLPAPQTYSASNCRFSPVCPPGGENRVGANGLPYVWPTATSAYSHGVPADHYAQETLNEQLDTAWHTEIEEDPFE